MRGASIIATVLWIVPAAHAQTTDTASMSGMVMPGDAKKPASDGEPHPERPTGGHHDMPGMSMPAPDSDTDMPAMPDMPGMQHEQLADEDLRQKPSPPAPTDHAADRFYDPTAMTRAREELRREHGGGAVPYSKVMASLLEYQASGGDDRYRWDGQAWFGGDIHRLVLKSEGRGMRGEGIETGEVQALYSRATGVYTDVQAGIRQDFDPTGRTYVTAGAQTLFPYWFETEAAVFVSTKGELLVRAEGSYDLRLTNRLILQPRAELNFAAQNTAETRTGAGLSDAEVGLRLRYEIRREFAPYIGISYDRSFGETATFVRAAGEKVRATSIVAGIRAFF